MKFHGKVIVPGTKEHRKMLNILAGRKPVFFRGRINRRGKKVLKMSDRMYKGRGLIRWIWE
jgi:hypothetical protein